MVTSGYSYADVQLKEASRARRGKKMYSLRGKGAAGNVLILSLVLKELKSLKKNLMLHQRKRVVTSGQDPTQLSFQLGKRNFKRSLKAIKKNISHRKLMQM